MAEKIPAKAVFNGSTVIGLQEFESGDTLGVEFGGTGAASTGDALTNLFGSPAKGSVIVADGTSWQPLPVGTNNQVLRANNAQPSGLEWSTPNQLAVNQVDLTNGDKTTTSTTFINVPGTLLPAFTPKAGEVVYVGCTFTMLMQVTTGVARAFFDITHNNSGVFLREGDTRGIVYVEAESFVSDTHEVPMAFSIPVTLANAQPTQLALQWVKEGGTGNITIQATTARTALRFFVLRNI